MEIVDLCTRAQATSDEIGNAFLSYLLAMAIQEARQAMRPPIPRSIEDVRDL